MKYVCVAFVYAPMSAYCINLDVNSIGSSSTVPLIGLRGRPSIDEDFLHPHPKKSIAELKEVGESDTFIVCGTFDGIVEGQESWYPSLIKKNYHCRG
jgi:hypothetical protein